ncbi:tetratricopeptide repeat protein [Kitasatospora sp. NPDC052896]|uniref:tetratricopeptide repeat protein n=1 Tax=Kitasatospora sp. NPDC052896 TaxID=3364061 RepID=UPI0037C7B4C2
MSNTISGGVFFHAVIQGRNITVQLPPQITPALSGLPPASPTFTGREKQVAELLRALAPSREQEYSGRVTAVAGLAGVGKTELVVQTATQALREPDWFPGGVLFVDMFGYNDERFLFPERALDGLLRALGMPGEHVPASLQDRSRLYRSVLAAFAEQGRRILVVIDNASTSEQVRPLLPTDPSTATLLTSRHTLDLDARLHDLDILDPGASIELLRQVLQQARGSADRRVQDAPEHAATIAHLCAGLPLALRIAAALLADTPTRPLASLATALEAAHTRLDRLRREDRAVRAAFDLSYQRLDGEHARMFRLLPLNPGPDVSSESAARLADTDLFQAEELLQDLARAHLIAPGRTWGRWRLHDLVRLYADQHGHTRADTDQRDAAQGRLRDHYRSTTQAADTYLEAQPAAASIRFLDRHQALAWLDDEHPNLVAIATPLVGHPETSIALAFALARYLNYRRYLNDLIAVTSTALVFCRRLGHREREGAVLNNLGNALSGVRRFDEAIDAHNQAIILFRELGDRYSEGKALSSLGSALRQMRRFDEAIDAHNQAIILFRELGDRHSEGAALNNLGTTLSEVRRFEEAIGAHTQDLAVCRELGDQNGESQALNNLGGALLEARRFEEAIEILTGSVAIYRELSDEHGVGQALHNLGSALRQVRRFEESIDAHAEAATIAVKLRDRYREGQALNHLGLALWWMRRFEEAIGAHTEAATIAVELADRHGEGQALNNLGGALLEVHRFDEAIKALTRATTICRELGDRYGEGQALNNLGSALSEVRRFEEAIDAHAEAATIAVELGDWRGEGQALNNLGGALLEVRRFDEATEALTRATTICRELGDRYGEGQALNNLGLVLRHLRRFEGAIDAHSHAAHIFRELGDRHGEGQALRSWAVTHNERWLWQG